MEGVEYLTYDYEGAGSDGARNNKIFCFYKNDRWRQFFRRRLNPRERYPPAHFLRFFSTSHWKTPDEARPPVILCYRRRDTN